MGASVNAEGLVAVRNRTERFFFRYFYAIIPVTYALRVILEYAESGPLPDALKDSVKQAPSPLRRAFAFHAPLRGAWQTSASGVGTHPNAHTILDENFGS